jgi:hypothetical protein
LLRIEASRFDLDAISMIFTPPRSRREAAMTAARGLRPIYHANCYAAFVIDPDGYRIEAVCHQAEV